MKKGKHFQSPLLHKVGLFLRSLNDLPPEKGVAVAVSAGIDSTVLAHSLYQWKGLVCCLAHFNHHLRGAESEADEKFCRRLAQRLRVPIYVGHGSTPQGNVQAHCRKERLFFLRRLVESGTAKAVATAHHRQDRVEAALLRLLRGTAAEGLTSFGPHRGAWLRPFYDVSRAEIETYAAQHRLAYRQDRSNRQEKYLRNQLRHSILPRLRKSAHGPIDDHLLQFLDLLREDERLLQQLARRKMKKLLLQVAAGELRLVRSALASAPAPLARRIFKRLARQLLPGWIAPTYGQMAAAMRALSDAKAGRRVIQWSGGVELEFDRDLLILRRTKAETTFAPCSLWPLPKRIFFSPAASELSFSLVSAPPPPSSDTCCLPCPEGNPLVLRTFAPGDWIRPQNLRGRRQKLGNFFTNHKIPLSFRRRWPLLAKEGGEVLSVLGKAQAYAAVKADRGGRFLLVEGLDSLRAALQFGLK